MNERLEKKLKTLPSAPGVYFHKDKTGEIIYVGKASVLKNRVRSYFRNDKDRDIKTSALVSEINDTDWIIVDTEMDALFLESEMIKRYKPKWNILLRDDKTVSYVKITMQEKVPYVSFTRNPLDDGATYIGPFYGKSALEKSVRALRKIFPFYIKPYDNKHTLDSDLGLAPGIEAGKTTPRKYKNNLKRFIKVLEGSREELIEELEKEMFKESEKGNYEISAELRNQIFGLKELKKKIIFSDKEFLDISSDRALLELKRILNLENPPRRIEGYDISHQSGTNVVASMVVFKNGVADRPEYRKFKLKNQQNNDPESLKEVISRRLKHEEWDYPDLIILDGGKSQVSAVLPLLIPYNIPVIGRDKSGDHTRSASVKLIIPKNGPIPPLYHTSLEKSSLSEKIAYDEVILPNGSHISRLIARIDDEAHRFAITYHNLLKRKNMLS